MCDALERLVYAAAAEQPVAFDSRSAALVPAFVEDALRKGARIVSGRAIDAAGAAGPLILAGVTPRMAIFAGDLFGPVLLLCAAHGAEEAVALANQSSFALGATIFGSERKARELAARLVAGVAMINDVIVPAGESASISELVVRLISIDSMELIEKASKLVARPPSPVRLASAEANLAPSTEKPTYWPSMPPRRGPRVSDST